MQEFFDQLEKSIVNTAIRRLFSQNEHYLKFASDDMVKNNTAMIDDAVSYALARHGFGVEMYEPVSSELNKQIESGLLTRPVTYDDPDESSATQEYQEDQGFSDDKFREQFGNSNANPNFKKRKDPREQQTQLEKLLMNSTLEEAFNTLGLRKSK